MKRDFNITTTIQIGNCVEVDAIVRGTYEWTSGNRIDPPEEDYTIEDTQLSDEYEDADLIDIANELMSGEMDRHAPWVDNEKINTLIRNKVEVKFTGTAEEARQVVEAFVKFTTDDDDLSEIICEKFHSGTLFDD